MKNRMDDLRNHFFEQLERLRDAEGSDELQSEISRAKAISEVGGKLIDSAKVEVQYLEATGQAEGSRFLRGEPERPPLAPVNKQAIGNK